MKYIKCPDCNNETLTARLDYVNYDKKNKPKACVYIYCKECDFAEEYEVDVAADKLSILHDYEE